MIDAVETYLHCSLLAIKNGYLSISKELCTSKLPRERAKIRSSLVARIAPFISRLSLFRKGNAYDAIPLCISSEH
jgi:hypothetical protein